MNFLSKLGGGGDDSTDKPHDHNPGDHHTKKSASDLFSSAKLVADAAKSSFGEGGDKGKVAGATADLIGTASDYGELDETKGVGKYAVQAEDYLNKYAHGTDAGPKPEPVPVAVEPPKKEESGEKEGGGSGFGDYLKGAGDFLKK